MIAKEDKDKQIEFLKDTLEEVSRQLRTMTYPACPSEVDDISDYIYKRLADVTY